MGRQWAGGAEPRNFLEGARAFHRQHGVVDVLAVVGRQRLIRVQPGRNPSDIAVLAVHENELSPAGASSGGEPLDKVPIANG